MKKSEMVQIITLLAGNYESIATKSQAQKEMMLATWLECLGDLDYAVVLHAVKKAIIESPYPPTIHDIRKNAVEIINPTAKRTGIEAWSEAYSMICNGLYMTEETFNNASVEVKKFFGNVQQVRELARSNIDTVNTVTKGQFLKQYDVIVEREEENKLLPAKMNDFVKTLSNKMNINQLEEKNVR